MNGTALRISLELLLTNLHISVRQISRIMLHSFLNNTHLKNKINTNINDDDDDDDDEDNVEDDNDDDNNNDMNCTYLNFKDDYSIFIFIAAQLISCYSHYDVVCINLYLCEQIQLHSTVSHLFWLEECANYLVCQ